MPISTKKQLQLNTKSSSDFQITPQTPKNHLDLTKIINKSQDFNPKISLNLKHKSVQLSSLFKRKIFALEVQIKHKNVEDVGVDKLQSKYRASRWSI